MTEDTLFLQLHKLPPTISAETLGHVLETLWKTRKTGLTSVEKSYIQSLVNLSSVEELDPVLACLRLLVRKCVHESFTGDDIRKQFPFDLPHELQSIIVLILQKYQNQWKEEVSRDQPPWRRTRVSPQVKVSAPSTLTPFAASEISTSLWPRQDDATCHFISNNLGISPIAVNPNVPSMAHVALQRDDGPPENLVTLPRLKSMTWTMENRNSTPTNRVAVISLKVKNIRCKSTIWEYYMNDSNNLAGSHLQKYFTAGQFLQDYMKTPSGETEVRFLLSRDTLEAMLRSMAYINEQLSNVVGPPPGPLQKKLKP